MKIETFDRIKDGITLGALTLACTGLLYYAGKHIITEKMRLRKIFEVPEHKLPSFYLRDNKKTGRLVNEGFYFFRQAYVKNANLIQQRLKKNY